MSCETAQTTVTTDAGKAWEHFYLNSQYVFSNQIPNLNSYTRTAPGWVLNDNGYCSWMSTPPARMREEQPIQAQQLSTAPALPQAGMNDGGFGVLVLLAAGAAGVWYYLNRGKEPDPDYHPMADLDYRLPALSSVSVADSLPDEMEWQEGDPIPEGYVLVDDDDATSQGNSSHGIPSVEVIEFEGNSHEFEGNSQNGQSANSLGIPQVSADSQDWPPKSMGAPYDATQPEQDGEFNAYRRAIDKDGLNPKGNDIIKVLWGVTPGRSAAYEAARKRRDDFARRLDYYRFEGA